MLTIVAAIEEELAQVRTFLAAGGYGPGTGEAPAFGVIGVGRKRVESGLRTLLPTLRQQRLGVEPPSELLLLGFAGGADPSLSAGDLTLAGRYCRLVPQPQRLRRDPDLWQPSMIEALLVRSLRRLWLGKMGGWASSSARPGFRLKGMSRYMNPILPQSVVLKDLEADLTMLQRSREALAQGGLTAVETDSMTVEELITDVRTKRELHRRFQVGAVNMEDYWVARLAAAAHVPFLSVRVILDTADQGLPYYLVGVSGRPAQAARQIVARQTMVRPWRIPTLLQLSRQMTLAQESLARFALAYVNQRAAEEGNSPAEGG